MPPRLTRITPAFIAVITWGVAIWVTQLDAPRFDGDDRLAIGAAITATMWAIVDYYTRWLAAKRVTFGEQVGLIAEGVAAEMRRRQDGGGDREHLAG